MVGRQRVALYFTNIARGEMEGLRYQIRTVNGLPALLIERDAQEGFAPRLVFQVELDGEGLVRASRAVLAPGKLTAIRWEPGE